MSDTRHWFLRLLALTAVCLTAGCQILPEAQPDRTRYFVLAAPSEAVAPEPADGRILGLRPVELPGYLRNTRSLVVARGPNELSYREDDRWAEPLDVGLARVLRETLQVTDGVRRVVAFPFDQQNRDLDLTVRVRHCEGADFGDGRRTIRFALSYELAAAGAGGELLKRGTFVAPETAWDGEAGSLAARLGEATAAAANAIAADLR
jgi:uncharacterized protein